jgi:2-oxoglutarate ferredoxin oxidoreductase subunit beta
MHDGSVILFKKLERDYDPTNRTEAIRLLEEAIQRNWLITGLLYIDPNTPNIFEMYSMGKMPLNRLPPEKIRPNEDTLEKINRSFR